MKRSHRRFAFVATIIIAALFNRSATAKENATLRKINDRMEQFVEAGQISGAVTLVAQDGKVIHVGAVGQRDVARDTAMTDDTIFAIASMTKPVTGTALMILVDEGKVKLDDPVAKYIPEFKNAKLKGGQDLNSEITVEDCLTHTAGLVGDQQCFESLEATGKMLAQRPLGFQPGEKWQYSPGLNVVGRVIEVASGQAYEDFLKERIFDPLGMQDTSFIPNAQQQKRVVTLYKPGKEKGTMEATTHWINDMSADKVPNPSGGLFSTAADMARFYQMVLDGGKANGKQIVSEASVKAMTTCQTGDLQTGFTPGNCWGLGWCVIREPQGVTSSLSPGTFGHGGAFGTQGWVDPERKMIFVLMIQRTGFGNSDGSDIRGEFHKLAIESLGE